MLNGKLKLQVHCQGCCPKRARLMLCSLKRFLCQFKHNLSKTKIIPESKKATNLFYGAVNVDICLLASLYSVFCIPSSKCDYAAAMSFLLKDMNTLLDYLHPLPTVHCRETRFKQWKQLVNEFYSQ